MKANSTKQNYENASSAEKQLWNRFRSCKVTEVFWFRFQKLHAIHGIGFVADLTIATERSNVTAFSGQRGFGKRRQMLQHSLAGDGGEGGGGVAKGGNEEMSSKRHTLSSIASRCFGLVLLNANIHTSRFDVYVPIRWFSRKKWKKKSYTFLTASAHCISFSAYGNEASAQWSQYDTVLLCRIPTESFSDAANIAEHIRFHFYSFSMFTLARLSPDAFACNLVVSIDFMHKQTTANLVWPTSGQEYCTSHSKIIINFAFLCALDSSVPAPPHCVHSFLI